MSYIEKKYLEKINEIFSGLTVLDEKLFELMKERSIKHVDDFALTCANITKQINLILKKYYPEIKEMRDKLDIKSKLKFYYDLIDNLTDFVRHVENFEKIDDNYFDIFIDFIKDKESLISGKYRAISSQELTAFYDQVTRNALEAIVAEKFEAKNHEFFAIGPLESEIKKIGKIAGADNIIIKPLDESLKDDAFKSAHTVLELIITPEDDKEKIKNVGAELKKYLESKKYTVKLTDKMIITNARLLHDKE
ncbi:MAG: hypothetical protein ACFFBP_20845 [Promethearchaeota archaeon]